MPSQLILPRRNFLSTVAFSACALGAGNLLAEELSRTAPQTEGPFYPDKLPLDTDNDLIVVNDNIDAAVGEVTHLFGRVLSAAGEPIANAEVEIWQVDNNGVYIHTRSPNQDQRDKNFQGFGRFLTGQKGEYYFRTIKPVPYTLGASRTPHIHVVVNKGSKRLLTTQLYVDGHPLNLRDGIYRRIPENLRGTVTVPFQPKKDSKIGELVAQCDIVVGYTAPDAE